MLWYYIVYYFYKLNLVEVCTKFVTPPPPLGHTHSKIQRLREHLLNLKGGSGGYGFFLGGGGGGKFDGEKNSVSDMGRKNFLKHLLP